MKHYLTRVWVFLLVAATLLSACFPVWAEKRPQASTAETDWSAVQRLPVGSLLLIEQTDGIRVRGDSWPWRTTRSVCVGGKM